MEMLGIIFRLLGSAMLNVALSVGFYLLKRRTKFGELNFWLRQVIIGVVFGAAAVFGTEFGVDVGGATANARDAAPLCAGLIFGAPAGIIAGVIGGVERWFAVLWGAGAYSRLACSLSTVLAGFYAALLRKFMFDNKRPTTAVAFAVGIVMEVVHLSILFITHIADAETAYEIVKICTIPMVLCNAVSVALSVIIINVLSYGIHKDRNKISSISQKVQARMLICVVLAYLFTTFFSYMLQTNTAIETADELMSLNITDVRNDIYSIDESKLHLVTQNRHVGETGYMLVADRSGNIVSGQGSHNKGTLKDAGLSISIGTEQNTMHTGIVWGEECYWMLGIASQYFVVAVYPHAETFATRDAAVYVNSFMEVLVFAALFALIYLLIKRIVVNNIRSVNGNLEQIIGGNLSITVDVRSSSEFASLSDDINSTVTTLKHYIDEAASRIDKELKLAKSIQLSALPSVFPAFPNEKQFEVFATMDTAKDVGGDFYDFYMLGEDKLAFLIADVSGKGIPAAMFMMRAKSVIKSLAEENLPVNEIFTNANEKLCEGNDAGMFVTAWMGILDKKTGHVTFANAGHNPPLLYRKDGSFEYLRSRAGLVLAGMEGIKYKLQEFDLAPGDRIYLYTDGVTEATDANQKLYGEERLNSFVNANAALSAEDMLRAVKGDIDLFVGEAEQFDDITMVMLDYFGTGDEQNMVERVFPAKTEALDEVTAFLEGELEKADCGMKTAMQMTVALEEIFVNVANYAYPGGEGDATVAIGINDGVATITVKDSGVQFDPLKKADPDVTLAAEDRGIGGLGIFMVKKTMDNVSYEYKDGCNILTMRKKI